MKTRGQTARFWKNQRSPVGPASAVRVFSEEAKALVAAVLKSEGRLVLKPVPVLVRR